MDNCPREDSGDTLSFRKGRVGLVKGKKNKAEKKKPTNIIAK